MPKLEKTDPFQNSLLTRDRRALYLEDRSVSPAPAQPRKSG